MQHPVCSGDCVIFKLAPHKMRLQLCACQRDVQQARLLGKSLSRGCCLVRVQAVRSEIESQRVIS